MKRKPAAGVSPSGNCDLCRPLFPFMAAHHANRATGHAPSPDATKDPALLIGWLQHLLADRYDYVLAEPIPTELSALLTPAH